MEGLIFWLLHKNKSCVFALKDFVLCKQLRKLFCANTKINSISSHAQAERLGFFFFLGFLSQTCTIHKTEWERRDYLFNFSVPLPPTSQALIHQSGNYCMELTSPHNQQLDSNPERLVSQCKSLTTRLGVLKISQEVFLQ